MAVLDENEAAEEVKVEKNGDGKGGVLGAVVAVLLVVIVLVVVGEAHE